MYNTEKLKAVKLSYTLKEDQERLKEASYVIVSLEKKPICM